MGADAARRRKRKTKTSSPSATECFVVFCLFFVSTLVLHSPHARTHQVRTRRAGLVVQPHEQSGVADRRWLLKRHGATLPSGRGGGRRCGHNPRSRAASRPRPACDCRCMWCAHGAHAGGSTTETWGEATPDKRRAAHGAVDQPSSSSLPPTQHTSTVFTTITSPWTSPSRLHRPRASASCWCQNGARARRLRLASMTTTTCCSMMKLKNCPTWMIWKWRRRRRRRRKPRCSVPRKPRCMRCRNACWRRLRRKAWTQMTRRKTRMRARGSRRWCWRWR